MGLYSSIKITASEDNDFKTGHDFMQKFCDDLIKATGDIYSTFDQRIRNDDEFKKYDLYRNGIPLGAIYVNKITYDAYYYEYKKAPFEYEKYQFNSIINAIKKIGGYKCVISDDYNEKNNATYVFNKNKSNSYNKNNEVYDIRNIILDIGREYVNYKDINGFNLWSKCDNKIQAIYNKYYETLTDEEKNNDMSSILCKPFLHMIMLHGYHTNETNKGFNPKDLCKFVFSSYNHSNHFIYFSLGIEDTLQNTSKILKKAGYPALANVINETLIYAKEQNLFDKYEVSYEEIKEM